MVTTVVVNLALWVGYAVTGLRKSDFGNVPGKAQLYFLISAALAYVANLVFIAMLAKKPESHLYAAAVCVGVYYILQLAFVPLVRASQNGRSANWVRSLLLMCIIPIAVLAGIAVLTRELVLVTLGVFVALHVVVNDAILFGYLF